MQASIVTPIVAFVGLIIHLIFGIELSEGQVNVITDGIVAISLFAITAIALVKAKKKK